MNQAEAFALPKELQYEDESGIRRRRPASAAPTVMSVARIADRAARRRAWLAFSVALGLAVGVAVTLLLTFSGNGETMVMKPMLRRAMQASPEMTVEMPGISSVVMTTEPAKKPKTRGRRR